MEKDTMENLKHFNAAAASTSEALLFLVLVLLTHGFFKYGFAACVILSAVNSVRHSMRLPHSYLK